MFVELVYDTRNVEGLEGALVSHQGGHDDGHVDPSQGQCRMSEDYQNC